MVSMRYLTILFAVLTACGNRIELKGNYEEINEDIKSQLEQEVLALIENQTLIVDLENDATTDLNIIDFRDTPKKFINYFARFAEKKMNEADLGREPLESATIEIVSPEMVQRKCGDTALACNMGGHIVMPNDLTFVYFMVVFNHEFGHQMYLGNAEYPALANEIYACLQTYKFSKKIGSFFLDFMFTTHGLEDLGQSSSFDGMYQKAALFAVYNLNRYGAQVEKALDYVLHVPQLSLEAQLDKFTKEYPKKSIADLHAMLWDSVIYDISCQAPRDENITLGLALSMLHSRHASWNGSKSVVDRDRVLMLLSKIRTDNKYFSTKAVKSRTYDLLYDSQNLADNADENTDIPYSDLFGISREILLVNNPYPCFEEDPYSCPVMYRGVQTGHLMGYDLMMFVAKNRRGYGAIFIDETSDFFYRFEPDKNLKTTNQMILMAILAGDILRDTEVSFEDVCRAQRFYRLANRLECNNDSILYSKYFCESEKIGLGDKIKDYPFCEEHNGAKLSALDLLRVAY